MALITRLDTAVTNGSTLPLALPSIGVDDYVGRWIANQLAGADNTAVAAWPAAYGTGRDLASPGGSASPTLKVFGSDKFVKFDGTDDVLTQSPTSAAWTTTALLFRFDTGSGTNQLAAFAANTGAWVQRASGGQVKVTGGGGVDLTTAAVAAMDTWHTLVVVQNGASSAVVLNGTVLNGSLGGRVASALMLGKSDSGFGAVSVAEALVYNRALTNAEAQALNTALRANHSALVA